MAIYIRGLNGETEHPVDGSTTLDDLRLAGVIGEGLNVRFNGEAVTDGSTEIPDQSVLVTTPPAAKHGDR